MPYSGSAECDQCDYRIEVSTSWHGVEGIYHLSRALRIPLVGRYAWCNECGEIRLAERLPTVAEIRTELRASFWNVNAWGRELWSCTKADSQGSVVTRRRHRQVLRAMLAWRKSRKSPARCLSCGSCNHEITHFDSNDLKSVVHPTCGGTIRFHWDAIWTGILLGFPAFSAEGVRDGVYRFVNDELQYFHNDDVYQQVTDAFVR